MMPTAGRPSAGRPNATRDKLINAVGARSAATPDRRRRTPKPAAPGEAGADTRPALARRGTEKRQQGINWDLALLEYAREAITTIARRHPEEPGCESLAALVDQGVREILTKWERKHYDGEAIPPL